MILLTPQDPRSLLWNETDQGSQLMLLPGSLNTTLNRSSINDVQAQDALNCLTDRGVWELDQRYREFAPSPVSLSGPSCVTKDPTSFTTINGGSGEDGGTAGGTWGGGDPGTGTACASGWGYYNEGSGLWVCSLVDPGV